MISGASIRCARNYDLFVALVFLVLLTLLAGFICIAFVLLLENPLLTRVELTGNFINLLLLAYALPALLMLLLLCLL